MAKALSLPIFDGSFEKAIRCSRYGSVAFVFAMVYFESTSLQLGLPVKLDPAAGLRKQSATASLLKPLVRPPKKVKVSSNESSSSTPPLDKERNLKWKWASRLKAIGARACAFAKLLQESAETSCWRANACS